MMSGHAYVIQRGDLLGKIANAVSLYRWQLTVQDILAANPGLVASQLKMAGSAVLYVIASGQAVLRQTVLANILQAIIRRRPAFVAEFVLTFFFLLIILGATDKRARKVWRTSASV